MTENIISYISAAVAALVIYIFAPYVRAKIGAERFETLRGWVRTAVLAAEQVYAQSGQGSQKKQFVKDFLERENVACTEGELDTMIESAVYCMNMEMWDR